MNTVAARNWTMFWCVASDQYGDGRTDYAPASFNCPPNAADLPQSRDNETLNVIIRKQLDNIISRHVPKGQSPAVQPGWCFCLIIFVF